MICFHAKIRQLQSLSWNRTAATTNPSHLHLFVVCSLGLLLGGCSAGQQPSSEIATSEGGYDEAVIAFEASEFQKAEAHLSAAIDAGGLNPDLVVDAYLLRAEARTELEKLDEAMADLAFVEQGVPDLGRFHKLRGDILLAQGDKVGARKAFKNARQIDKSIKLPAPLK